MAVPLLGRLWPLSPHLLTGVTPEFSPSSPCSLSRVSHGILSEYTIALEGLQVYTPNALDIQTSAVICLLMLSLSRLGRKKTIGWKLGLSSHPTAFHTIQRNALSNIRSYTHLSPGWLKSNSQRWMKRTSHSRVVVKYESTKILQQKYLQIQNKNGQHRHPF